MDIRRPPPLPWTSPPSDLDDRRRGPWLQPGAWRTEAGPCPPVEHGRHRYAAGPAGGHLRSIGASRCVRSRRRRHGAEEPRSLRRPPPATRWPWARSSSAIRRPWPRWCRSSPPASTSATCWRAIRKVSTCLRLTEGAPVARQMLVEDLVAEVEALDHDQAVLRGAAAFQAPRDAADRLRRHHPRAEPEDGHRADFLPGRRHPGGGVAGRLAEAPTAAGHAPRPRRPPGAVRRPGHGQARRPRTELLQRHRPGLPLRRRRQDRRPAARSATASSSTTSPAS